MSKQYKLITHGRRTGQVASPQRRNMRPECRHEYHVLELLNVVYDHYDLNPIIDEHAVKEAYKAVSGEMITKLTTRMVYSKGILTLYVSAAALKQEILMRKTNLIAKLNEHIGRQIVTDIKVF